MMTNEEAQNKNPRKGLRKAERPKGVATLGDNFSSNKHVDIIFI